MCVHVCIGKWKGHELEMLWSDIIKVQWLNGAYDSFYLMIVWLRLFILVWTLTLGSQFAFYICVWLDREFLVCSRSATSNVTRNSMPQKLLNKSHHQKNHFNFEQQMWPCGRKAWERGGDKKKAKHSSGYSQLS